MKKLRTKETEQERFNCKSTCEKCGFSIDCKNLNPKDCKNYFLDFGTNFCATSKILKIDNVVLV
jgi:hypothetical protein